MLHFGIPDLCGRTSSSFEADTVERQILEALHTFEPRILRHTLSVQAMAAPDLMDHNAVSFEIKGDLWAQPMPDTLYVKTEVDLETGHCELKARANG